MFRRAVPLTLLALAACATPAQRITAKLVDFGVPARQARCAGDELAARLSTEQLRRLAGLISANKAGVGRMRLSDLVRQLNEPGDPEIVAVVLKVGLGCALQ